VDCLPPEGNLFTGTSRDYKFLWGQNGDKQAVKRKTAKIEPSLPGDRHLTVPEVTKKKMVCFSGVYRQFGIGGRR